MIDLLYGQLMNLRNQAYDRAWFSVFQAPVPVISVGNISVGGTGKTPMAEYLIRLCLADGKTPAYLSRGYGRKTKGFRRVHTTTDDVRSVGDEALQIALKFPKIPVVVCENRKEGIIRLLEQESVDLFILDDAFQHRRVARDTDLLMIDAGRLPTQDKVLPWGRLREPIKGINRADVLIVNRVDEQEKIALIKAELDYFQKSMAFCRPRMQGLQAFHTKEILPLESLKGQSVVVFSGIGNHSYFVKQLRQQGAIIVREKRFRDHHYYTQAEIDQLSHLCPEDGILLTTEKDYCRLRGRCEGDTWHFVPMELEWLEGEERIIDYIRK